MQNEHFYQTPFFQRNIGALISGIVIVSSIIVTYGRVTYQIDDFSRKIKHMDENGTAYSHENISLDHQIIMAHENRIQKTEELLSRFAVITEKVDRISQDIKEIKNK